MSHMANKEKRTAQTNSIKQNWNSNLHCQEKMLSQFDFELDSKSEIYVCDTSSVLQTSLDNNSFGDITENLDSVYSHKQLLPEDSFNIKSINRQQSKLVRYTVKRDKDLRKKKQKHGAKKFSPQEDRQLLNYILKKGPKFHKFSRYFPGKTTNMLKNRYYKQLRFVWDQTLGSEYAYLNAQPEEPTQSIHEKRLINFTEDIIQLELFPEAEELLSNFLFSLSQTFVDMQQGTMTDE